jgi:hypothetical protein
LDNQSDFHQSQENFGGTGANNNDPAADPATKKYSVWQIEYYQQYFNVNTSDVTSRILGSMVPTFAQNYLLTKIRPNPDLYGPFWVSVTLIFSIAIAGNIQSFFQQFGSKFQWETDFHKGKLICSFYRKQSKSIFATINDVV